MAIIGSLVGFGLRQVLPESTGSVVETVERWFRDHSQTLPRALERAHDRAWQSLGVALAGNGFLDRIKLFFASGDDRGIREQVQRFLKDNVFSFDGTPDGFRQACLDDLKRLRKSGLLSLKGDSSGEIARQTASFKRHADPQGLIEEAQKAVSGIADVLVEGYPNLSRLIRRPTPAGPSLLAVAFCYFFRREVEGGGELAHGLFFDGLRQLSAAQAKGFGEVNKALVTLGGQFDALFEQLGRIESAVVETHGAVLDLQVELQRLGGLHLANAEEVQTLLVQVLQRLGQVGMQRGEVRPQYSFSIHSEDERQAIRALLARFRRLSANEQQQVPALLNGLGMLQVGAGDFEQARQTFAEVANRVTDPASKAEASFNAYRSALEQKKWDEALEAVLLAARLAPARFAPFPLQRYLPQRILGAGGFGTVFLCQDAHFRNREVAIKALHDATLDRSLGDVFGEAHALTELNHPCLIGVLDCSYADLERQARPFLVMPYFPGISLETYIREHGPLGVEEFLAVALQVARGMQAAHERHVLHRDLKPENILVRREGGGWQVKIIDFGLALRRRAVETPGARAAEEDTVLGRSVAGTLLFAPPEQMGRLPGVAVGPYSDVYAFGKTCCYALFRTTEPKTRHWAAIRNDLAKMLEKCTEQELDERHRSFGLVLDVLECLALEIQERERQRAEAKRQLQEQTEAEAERQRLAQQRVEEHRRRVAEEQQQEQEKERVQPLPLRLRLLPLKAQRKRPGRRLWPWVAVALSMMVIVAIAVFLAPPKKTEDDAVKELEKLGAKIKRDEARPGKPVVAVDLRYTQVTDAGLKELAPLKDLQELDLSFTQVTDAGLKELASFKDLQKLCLGSNQGTAAGLKELVSLKNLKELLLPNEDYDDAGVKDLHKALPDCQILVYERRKAAR